MIWIRDLKSVDLSNHVCALLYIRTLARKDQNAVLDSLFYVDYDCVVVGILLNYLIKCILTNTPNVCSRESCTVCSAMVRRRNRPADSDLACSWRLCLHWKIVMLTTSKTSKNSSRLPQNDIVASLDLSSGGAQWRHIPWHAGYVTPWTEFKLHFS